MLLINRYSCIIFFALSISLLAACSSNSEEKNAMDAKYKKLNELVAIGMNIDNAANILRENGYTVGQKEYPTAQKDYSQIIVPLSKKIPASATIAETTGKGKGMNIYAIIKADKNDIIFEIYH